MDITWTDIRLVHIRSMCLRAPQGGKPQCIHSLPTDTKGIYCLAQNVTGVKLSQNHFTRVLRRENFGKLSKRSLMF